ncbi:ABC transporter substrate-binding protein [Nocardia mangyaensis]|uniref:ABC transporter substrate-binding protein n=1 Tax=Nocardia mangyaensis TaxID=2213200 RepID=UPI0026769737|nr:ABC transporter substrate-binding protein [Nocardia mangyaensis]MDO3645586.1 ABC transporter substrate-binding protein [Nocardia mangyaensis]
MSSPPGGFDRRNFLRTGGVVAAAIFGGAALAACTSAVSEQKAGGDATPVRGGTLKFGIRDDLVPANLLTNTGATPVIVGLVYESLIRYPNDELEPQPLLAKSWELAADGRSLSLDLRDDVKFHSGRSFTAKDVEFSIRTYADAKWSAQLRSTATAVTGFDIVSPTRIVLRFAHPLSNVYDLLDTVPILDSESVEQLGTGDTYIGTGPFRFVQRVPNSQLVFEKNPDYWVPERPYLDRVEIAIIPDPQALLNALKSGQIAAARELGYRDAENLAKGGGYQVLDLEGAELQSYVGVNVTVPELADVRVRQAIAYALDRDRIVAEVYRGAGYPLNVPWPKNSPAYDESRNTRYSRDIDKAEQLLTEAGTPPKLPLTFAPGYQETAQIVQSNLADIGIEVELDPVDGATFVKQLTGAQFRGLWVTDHSWAQFVPSTLTVSAYPFNARRNASHYESPAYVAAADAAWQRAESTGPEAVQAYKALSDQLLEGLFLIEIGVRYQQYAASNQVHDLGWTKRREPLLTDTFLS